MVPACRISRTAARRYNDLTQRLLKQLPRYLSFEEAGGQNRRPFFTELSVFQAEKNGVVDVTEDEAGKLDLICSVSGRAYSADGQLKQASTGFFELKRSGDL